MQSKMTSTDSATPRKRTLTPSVPTSVDADPDNVFTPPSNTRKLVPYMERETNLWQVRYEGGGPVPLPLRGKYTSKRTATEAIEKHLEINAKVS
jgi:hypothetical protein